MKTRYLLAVVLLLAGFVRADVEVTAVPVTVGGGGGAAFTGGAILTPILAPAADNCATPPYSFTSDTDTGMCTATADNLSLRTGGTNRVTVNSTSATSTVPFLAPDGSNTAPAYAFSGAAQGFYRSGGQTVFAASSADIWWTAASSIVMRSNGAYQFSSGTTVGTGADTGIARHSAGVLRFGVGVTINGLHGGGGAVASATAMPVPTGGVFHVTGTTTITSITSTNFGSGVCITLIFDGILTLTDGSNLKMAGDFVTSADDTWTGCYDGTNWYETGRTVN